MERSLAYPAMELQETAVITQFIKQFSAGWVAFALSCAGAAALYLWQPITEFFFLKTYEENIVLSLSTDVLPSDKQQKLLVVTMKLMNRGNVPVIIKSNDREGRLSLEVSRIEKSPAGQWLDPATLPTVSQKDLLKKHEGRFEISPDAFFNEVEAISLPPGNYWVRASMSSAGGSTIEQSTVVAVKEKEDNSEVTAGHDSRRNHSSKITRIGG